MKIKTSLMSLMVIGGIGYYLKNKQNVDSQFASLRNELNLNIDNFKEVLLASKKLQASVRNFSEILNDNQDSIAEFNNIFSKNS